MTRVLELTAVSMAYLLRQRHAVRSNRPAVDEGPRAQLFALQNARRRPGDVADVRSREARNPWFSAWHTLCDAVCAAEAHRQKETTMIKRISIGVTMVSLASVAVAGAAGGLTDLMQSSRMTVVKVDATAGSFLCAEHRKWTAVSGGDLAGVTAGDIVRIDKRAGGAPRITIVRIASDELASPEH
jgi:hypothetical protein